MLCLQTEQHITWSSLFLLEQSWNHVLLSRLWWIYCEEFWQIYSYAIFMILRVFLFIHKYYNQMLKAYWPIKFDFPWANWNLGIWLELYRHFAVHIALICSKDHNNFQWSIWLPFRNVLYREGSKKKESVIVVLVNCKHTRNQLFSCWKTLSSISFIHIFWKYLSCINSSRG